MTARGAGGGPKVGFFGTLGSGNLGNDGSLDAVVAFVRRQCPDASLGFMCMGPEWVTARYTSPATSLQWYEAHTGSPSLLFKIVGKLLDPFRIVAWVRRHDAVIVPGMGVLEATVPVRPWGMPYALFWLGVGGRLFRTKIALVSVGAQPMRQKTTRWLLTAAARLAHYRSYRDVGSREAMRQMGIDVSVDEVYLDLAFALPVPEEDKRGGGVVGVGLMAYRGSNDDRACAEQIHRAYMHAMKRFVRWLVETDHIVRLITGDKEDEPVLSELLADLREHRPGLDPSRVLTEPALTLQDLMRQLATVDTVVATRYHNVICALMMCRPTLSVGYAAKHEQVMAQMGLGEFCESARTVDADRLIERFIALESCAGQLIDAMAERNRANLRRVERQFEALSYALFGSAGPQPVAAARMSAPGETG
jgi:polysaccharide pyruvyl transferase WcaK-like protein